MTQKEYAKLLYNTYIEKGLDSFQKEFNDLLDSLVYSDGDKKGTKVPQSYYARILNEIKLLETPNSHETFRAISQLAQLIKSLSDSLDLDISNQKQ